MIDGLDAIAVREPLVVDSSVVVKGLAPAIVPAVAVSPATQLPPDVAPYVIVAVPPFASVSPVHWIVFAATPTAPEAELTQPAPAVVLGAVQPAGIAMSTSPLLMPPVAAV